MTDLDLHKIAFPTLDDVHVATLAKFGQRLSHSIRQQQSGECLW